MFSIHRGCKTPDNTCLMLSSASQFPANSINGGFVLHILCFSLYSLAGALHINPQLNLHLNSWMEQLRVWRCPTCPRRSHGWEVEGDHGEWVKQLRGLESSVLFMSCDVQLHNREVEIGCSRFLCISKALNMFITHIYIYIYTHVYHYLSKLFPNIIRSPTFTSRLFAWQPPVQRYVIALRGSPEQGTAATHKVPVDRATEVQHAGTGMGGTCAFRTMGDTKFCGGDPTWHHQLGEMSVHSAHDLHGLSQWLEESMTGHT